MRKIFFLLLAVAFVNAKSQNDFKPLILGDSVSLKLGGFVRNEIFYDTRKMSEVVDGLFNYYPDKKDFDARGKDINDAQSVNMLAITTRLNGLFIGPNVFNAKSSAFFEFDFTGLNTTNGVRFRQGWTKLKWAKSELLMGQFWHPYFLLENAPTVLGLNTGAPYATFNRSPQIRYSYNFTPKISAFLAAVYHTASGVSGPSAGVAGLAAAPSVDYLRTGGAPELVANVQYKAGSFVFGASGGMKAFRPRTYTTPVANGSKYKTMYLLKAYTCQAYGAYTYGLLKVKASVIYGQELSELNMLGGYAVASRNSITGHETYSPQNDVSTWLNITYGKDFMVGLFTGFAKNLGTSDNYLAGPTNFFGRGDNIKYIYRISPHFSYRVKRFQFGMEFEHNVAAYGTPDVNNKGLVTKAYEVKGMRVLGTMMFYF